MVFLINYLCREKKRQSTSSNNHPQCGLWPREINTTKLEIKMFCVVCSVRYSNPKLMHVGHQYMADNFDPKTFDGLLEFKAFHLAPDKGLGIFTFNNQENLKKHLSDIKKFNEDYGDRFSCKITVDTGIVNPDLYFKA